MLVLLHCLVKRCVVLQSPRVVASPWPDGEGTYMELPEVGLYMDLPSPDNVLYMDLPVDEDPEFHSITVRSLGFLQYDELTDAR